MLHGRYIDSSRLLLNLSLTIVRTIARGLPARITELIRVFRAVPRNMFDEAFKSNISLVSLRLASSRLTSLRLAKSHGESRPGATLKWRWFSNGREREWKSTPSVSGRFSWLLHRIPERGESPAKFYVFAPEAETAET